MKVNKKTLIKNAINKNPEIINVLLENGFFCVGCPKAQQETIEEGAKAHGFSKEKIETLLKKINKEIKKSKK